MLAERGAILLDELRWLVLRREARAKGKKLKAVTVSQASSFARTVREHMPEVHIRDIALSGRDADRPYELIAATAVFRIRQPVKLDSFLGGSSPTVVVRYLTDLPVHEFGEMPRYRHSNFATPQYHLYVADLYSSYESQRELTARVRMPPSHKITIVAADGRFDIKPVLASQTWRVVVQD